MGKILSEENNIAPEFRVNDWIDNNGNKLEKPIRLNDYKGKFRIIYCFQHWCPGCHSIGLPSLKKLVDAFKGNDKVVFLAVQTVFEGYDQNTYEKMAATQKQYDLHIPFGQDDGLQAGEPRSTIMTDYHTGGTPWFIFINERDEIVFAGFHVNVEGVIEYLKLL